MCGRLFFVGKRRYNIKLWKTFTDCFNCLPIAAIIDEKIFTMHGGLSPDLQSMEQIRRVMRPTDVPDTGSLANIARFNGFAYANPLLQDYFVIFFGLTQTRTSQDGRKTIVECHSPLDPMSCPGFCKSMTWTSSVERIKYVYIINLQILLVLTTSAGRRGRL